MSALKLEATRGYDQVYLVGSGVRYRDALELDGRYTLCEGDYPKAGAMGRLAYEKWRNQAWASLGAFKPTYLSTLNRYKKMPPVT